MVFVINNTTGLSQSRIPETHATTVDIPDKLPALPSPVAPQPTNMGSVAINEFLGQEYGGGYLTIYGVGVLTTPDTIEIKLGQVEKLTYTDSNGQTVQLNLISGQTGGPLPIRYYGNHIQIMINNIFQNFVGSKTLNELIGTGTPVQEPIRMTKDLIFYHTGTSFQLATPIHLSKNKVTGLDGEVYTLKPYGVPGNKYSIILDPVGFRVPGYKISASSASVDTLEVEDLSVMYHTQSTTQLKIIRDADSQYVLINNLPIDMVKDMTGTYALIRVGDNMIPIQDIMVTEATIIQYDPDSQSRMLAFFGSTDAKQQFFDQWTRINVDVPITPVIPQPQPDAKLERPIQISESNWALLSPAERQYIVTYIKLDDEVALNHIIKVFTVPLPGASQSDWDKLTPQQKIDVYNSGNIEIIGRLGPGLIPVPGKPNLPVDPTKPAQPSPYRPDMPNGDRTLYDPQAFKGLSTIQTYLLTHPNRAQSSVIKQTPIFEPRELTTVDLSMLHQKSDKSLLQQMGGTIIIGMLGGIAWAYYAKNKDQFDLDPYQKEVLDVEKTDRQLTMNSNTMQNEAMKKYQEGVAGLQTAKAMNAEEDQAHGVLGQALRRATKSVIDNTTMNYADKVTRKLTGTRSEEEKEDIRRAQAREDALFSSELRGTEEERRHKLNLEARTVASKLIEERGETAAERNERIRRERLELKNSLNPEIKAPPPIEPFNEIVGTPEDITDQIEAQKAEKRRVEELNAFLEETPLEPVETPEEIIASLPPREEPETEVSTSQQKVESKPSVPEATILEFPEVPQPAKQLEFTETPEYPPTDEQALQEKVSRQIEEDTAGEAPIKKFDLYESTHNTIHKLASKKHHYKTREVLINQINSNLHRLTKGNTPRDKIEDLVQDYNDALMINKQPKVDAETYF